MDLPEAASSYTRLDSTGMSGNGMRRDVGTFGDKVSYINSCIQSWSPCEQSIAVYSILWNLRPAQVKFLSAVIDSIVRTHGDCLQQAEADANNPSFINGLHRIGEERALEDLLQLIQLLRPGSENAVKEYMTLLPKVLLGCSEDVTYLNKCRQLISIALVHPAFRPDQRNALAYWLQHLDEKWRKVHDKKSMPPFGKRHTMPKSPQNVKMSMSPYGSMEKGMSNSLTHNLLLFSAKTQGEPTNREGRLTVVDEPNLEEVDESTKADNCASEDWTDTNGTSPPQKNTFEDPDSGMKQVPIWLKSLRLHKYQDLFRSMTYDEMLGISDEFLQQKKVTQGARNKIVQSIKSLSQRHEALCRMEQEIVSARHSGKGDAKAKLDPFRYIDELHQILITPMKTYHSPVTLETEEDSVEEPKKEEKERKDSSNSGSSSDEDSCSSGDQDQDDYSELLLKKDIPPDNLPMLIARVMSRVHELLYSGPNIEDSVMAFIKLVDRALCHEAFHPEERKLFFEWKQQCQSHLRITSPRRGNRGKGFGSYTFGGMPSRGGPTGGNRKPNTIGRSHRMRGMGGHNANKSSSVPRLNQRQLSIGPFSGGMPISPYYGESSVMNERTGSHNHLLGENGGNPSSLSRSASLTKPVSSPQPAPQYIKSKEETSDDHILDLCWRVTAQALSDDPLDGMSISLSGHHVND